MATDNTTLNSGSGGDTVRTVAKTSNSPAKTQAILLDIGGGADASPETILTAGQQTKALSVSIVPASDLTNLEPQGSAITGASLPTGGVGLTGWLSAIWSKLSGTLSVSWSGQSVSVSNLPATQAISAAALPLPTNAAADGTDSTGVTQLTGGVGIRGWLSGIFSKLSGTLATSETYANLAVNAAGASGAPISVSNSSATLLAAARTGRKEVTIIFESAVQARIGGSTVTATAYGALYGGVAQEAITISGGAAIYGFGVGGTAAISVLEVY